MAPLNNGLPGSGSAITEYPMPTASSSPEGVAVTPNGNAWFAEADTSKIGEVTPGGSFTEYPIPRAIRQRQPAGRHGGAERQSVVYHV